MFTVLGARLEHFQILGFIWEESIQTHLHEQINSVYAVRCDGKQEVTLKTKEKQHFCAVNRKSTQQDIRLKKKKQRETRLNKLSHHETFHGNRNPSAIKQHGVERSHTNMSINYQLHAPEAEYALQ